MGNGALAIGPKLPRPSSTLPKPKILAVQRFLPQLGVQRKGLAQLSFVCPFAKIRSNRIRRRPSAWLRPPNEFTA
jgi:hypothetical protein